MAQTLKWFVQNVLERDNYPTKITGLKDVNLVDKGITPTGSSSLTDATVYETTAVVADDYGVEVLWLTGDGGLTGYDFLWLESDVAVVLELGSVGNAFEQFVVGPGHPISLCANQVAISAVQDGVQSTLHTVDKISVQRNVADGQGDATVTLLLIKNNA